MVIYRVSENINIKTTDGTLVKYNKFKSPSNLFNDTIYISTFEDFDDLKKVFQNVGSKYKARVIDESKIRYLSQFPRELGVSNANEYSISQNLDFKYNKKNITSEKEHLKSLYLDETPADIDKQLKGTLKKDISLLILGNPGLSVSQMICASTALRILFEHLKKSFKSIKLDIYLNASENKYYSRDKMIFSNQNYVNRVSALSLNVKEFCEYDFFIDLSSVTKRSFYKELSPIDAWLHKFGIDYRKVDNSLKYNQINISSYKPNSDLKKKIEKIKLSGKTLLFHPFSANIEKSMPKEIAVRILKELLIKLPDYTIISALKIDSKIDHDAYIDLSAYSKSFLDFSYIISNMTKVLTVNTSTYHIADAFFIPTVVIFSEKNEDKFQVYETSKSILIEDKSKNFSQFIFDNESLLLYKYEGWNSIKTSQIIKLLESF